MTTKKRIGDLLVESQVIPRPVAENAAVETVLADTRILSVLVRDGHLDAETALRALAAQLGVPGVDLTTVVVPAPVLARVPANVAREDLLLPLRVDGASLLLAMANPYDQGVIDEISFATGLQILPLAALHLSLVEAVRVAYAAPDRDFRAGAAVADDDGSGRLTLLQTPAPTAQDESLSEEPIEIEIDFVDEPLELAAAAPPAESPPAGPAPPASPAPPVSASPPSPAPPNAPVAGSKTILVVDDESEIVHLIVETIKSLGHTIVTAQRGVEALNLVKTAKPSLVILDAMLPEVHGFEICRKIKESKRFARTPVLMVSAIYRGWRIAEDIKNLYKVDVFLEKPFRIAELRRQVERLLADLPEEHEEVPSSAPARAAYEQAIAAFQANQLDQAFGLLRQAEALEPFSANIQFMLGRVLERQNRAYQAIYHYERAIELNPQQFAATKNLALLYQANGFKNKAIEMWERSLRAAPSAELREQIKQHIVSIL